MWPQGGAPSTEWIRDHVEATLDLPLRRDGQGARRLPHRMHWLLWLLDDFELKNQLAGVPSLLRIGRSADPTAERRREIARLDQQRG